MKTRYPQFIGKVFKDEKGKPYEGERIINSLDPSTHTGLIETIVNYRNGRIHGSPAIHRLADLLEEEWDNGNFVKTLYGPVKRQ